MGMWFDVDVKRVLIVEDEPMLRTLLGGFLTQSGFEVRLAQDAAEANAISSEFKPDAALLDIHLGSGPSGLDLAIAFAHLFPKIAIIFLTNVGDPRLVGHHEAQLPRGYAYLLKSHVHAPEDVVSVVEAALEGRTTFDMRENLLVGANLTELSDSQIQVLRMVAAGASNRQIAQDRGTTERAVESLIQRAAAALNVKQASDSNLRVQVAMAYLRALGIPTHA